MCECVCVYEREKESRGAGDEEAHLAQPPEGLKLMA